MDDPTLLQLFGGNLEGFQYYKKLRETLLNRDDLTEGGPSMCPLCDPDDEVVSSRLKASGYTYQAVLKSTEEILREYSGHIGYDWKQTALDGDEVPGDDFNSGGSNVEKGRDDCTMDQGDGGRVFTCGQAGCTLQFSSVADYESHYHNGHQYTCTVCHKVLVSGFMLDVHVEENHDSYFTVCAVLRDMYRCLVESCSLKFKTPELRKQHLVKDHKFPASFAFHKPTVAKPYQTKQKKNKMSSSHEQMDSQTSACMNQTDFIVRHEHSTGDTLNHNELKSQNDPNPKSNHSNDKPMSQTDIRRPRAVPANVYFGQGCQRSFQHAAKQKRLRQGDDKLGFSRIMRNLDTKFAYPRVERFLKLQNFSSHQLQL